jgi:hypothetical protein
MMSRNADLMHGPILAAVCLGLTVLGLAQGAQAQTADPKGSWTSKAPLSSGRNEVAGVAFNNKFYVLGGIALVWTAAHCVDFG